MIRRCCLILLVIGFPIPSRADNWPAWRGPNGDGVCQETNVPLSWSSDKNIAWKANIPGEGAATPVVWNDAIFLTSQEEDKLIAYRLDGADGRIVWRKEVGAGVPLREGPKGSSKFHQLHNMASPSPVTDGKRVVFHFGNGDLICFGFDGELMWKTNLADELGHYTIWWGHANSPILWRDLVINVCMQDPINGAKSYLLALNLQDGKRKWLTDRDTGAEAESADSYTTTMLVRENGKETLVVMGGNVLDSYDPATGKQIWKVTGLDGGRTITGPTIGDGLVFATHGMRGPIVAIELGGAGDVTQSHLKWSEKGNTPDSPCPVYANGLLFCVTDDGIATCRDGKTGELRWRERLGGGFKASPIVAESRVYFTNMEGLTTIIKAAEKYEMLAKNDLKDPCIASFAVSNGSIFIRGKHTLYCVRNEK
jgi:outer membrane protein assembly factor BamB